MKKGISLIVLVITIIVMIIIAGAIIISLSQNNIVEQAGIAKRDANLANARAVITTAWADSAVKNNGVSTIVTLEGYQAYLTNAGLTASDYTITNFDAGACPDVELSTPANNG